MTHNFVFEPPSDEEIEHSESEDDYNVESDSPKKKKNTQSPWDFSKYSESVAEQHAQRSTTSIDDKISNVLRFHSTLPLPDPDYLTSSDSEPDKQVDYRQEEEEEEDDNEEEEDEGKTVVNKLILSRPLLRACEALGYAKPTPIQEDYRQEEEDEGEEEGNTVVNKSFFAPSDGASFSADSFLQLNLSRPLVRACEALGYAKPTPIQAACIPLALAGRDICGSAITGSGKTAAFILPTLERLLFRPKHFNGIRVLILTPTRELAAQVHSMTEKLAQFTDIRCCLIIGGEGQSIKVQEIALRSMPDIVVATPGRMIDHLRNSMSVDLDDLAVLILDEADNLLELGFSAEFRELVKMLPKKRQTMLFSATMTEKVDDLIKLSLSKPLRLSADPSAKRPGTLTEEVVKIRRMREVNKEAVLLAICSKTFTSKVIIFSGTKQAAHRLRIIFGLAGMKAAEFHGDLTQAQRLEALEQFRKQQVDFLVTTDMASRGLDIIGVQTVISFACPRDLTRYVHRVGRTARAGRVGYAVTFVTDNDRSLLKAIEKRACSKLKSHNVAEQSILNWSQVIEQMEDQISDVLQEERVEKALRKAEMKVTKAINMNARKEEILSRPKRTWFVTEKEKKLLAKEARASMDKEKGSEKEVISAQQAEDLKLKEKRKREREKHLPRKKRRKLESAREMLEDVEQDDMPPAAKIVKKPQKKSNPARKTSSRTEEMRELFQTDIKDKKPKTRGPGAAGKKIKTSFKSKSRYKRK